MGFLVSLFMAKKNPKKPQDFFCEICDFNTSNKKDYNRHLETKKHMANLVAKKNPKSENKFICNCGNNYFHASSLSKHKKKCCPDVKPIIISDLTEEQQNMVSQFVNFIKNNNK